MFGIIDCNNFFVSCERVFHPELRGRAVVVLSNNDGCVVARSNEAKQLGIKMGTPFFKIRHLATEGGLHVRSGNLALYRDMSHRVMDVVRSEIRRMEQYSIDECFIEVTDREGTVDLGRRMVQKVRQLTGIPVSVGLAPTKTLAKMAGGFAKRYPGYQGCCRIQTEEQRVKALKLTDIEDVWGIGHQLEKRLRASGIATAYDFTQWREGRVRRMFSLPTVHTWRELRGHPCMPLTLPTTRQSITSSRSFKQPVTDLDVLYGYVAEFCAECTRKLRRDNSVARRVSVYIRTDRFRPDLLQYANTGSSSLVVATADPRELIRAAHEALSAIYRPGYGYKKAGVTLTELTYGASQGDLFDTVDRLKQERLLQAMDMIHRQNGYTALQVAAQVSLNDAVSHKYRSPNYTTSLDDVITVR